MTASARKTEEENSMTDIVVPALGESVTEATVGKWTKAAGDAVARDEVLVELETDKVTLEVSAPEDGVLAEILAQEGANVEIGALLGRVGANGAAAAPPAEASEETPADELAAAEDAPAAEADETAAPADGELVEIVIPQMGESVAEGTISRWLVDVGASVAKDDPLVEIETDKVAVEAPSPVDGVLAEQVVKVGDTVAVGALIARVAAGAAAASQAQAAPAAEAEPLAPIPSDDEPKMMPSAARVVEEKALDAGAIAGTGKAGRITKADALAAAAPAVSRAPARPEPPAAARELGPREERVTMSRLRQTIARRLKEAQASAAMLTTFNEADMTAVIETRAAYKALFEKKHGVKLGFMSFFAKACVQALKEIPAVNAEIDGADIIYKNYYDIGVAVGTDQGLVVPVVRDCDAKSMGQIEKDIADLGARARDGKLSIQDMQGATFTMSNGGVYGSLMSTPILNAPQSGILGMHKIQPRPMAVDGEVKIRPMMYLALSYDHRIVDGKEAVTFLVRVKEGLEDPERLLLDI